MSRIKFLTEEVAEKRKAIEAIDALCEKEGRARTSDEKEEWRKLEDEVSELEAELEDAKKVQERKKVEAQKAIEEEKKAARAAGGSSTGEKKELNKLAKKFSITRGIDLLSKRKPLDGVEAEMDQEARKSGNNIEGNFAIPHELIAFGKRDLTIGTEGGDIMQTDLGGVIPVLRPDPVVVRMGAQTLTGLQGDFQLPRVSAASTMAWEGETDANAETTPTFDNIKFSPKRVGGYIQISGQAIRQSSFAIEQWTRNELQTALQEELDSVAINGGGAGEPTGILQTSGIGDVANGTNGGALDYADCLELIQDVVDANATSVSVGALSTPGVKFKLAQTPLQGSGVEGNFIVSARFLDDFLGYRYEHSTLVPSNLTKGTGTNLHAIIFGDFNELMIGQFGGIDLLVDPYSSSKSALLDIVINGYFDVQIRHAASFAASQDVSIA